MTAPMLTSQWMTEEVARIERLPAIYETAVVSDAQRAAIEEDQDRQADADRIELRTSERAEEREQTARADGWRDGGGAYL